MELICEVIQHVFVSKILNEILKQFIKGCDLYCMQHWSVSRDEQEEKRETNSCRSVCSFHCKWSSTWLGRSSPVYTAAACTSCTMMHGLHTHNLCTTRRDVTRYHDNETQLVSDVMTSRVHLPSYRQDNLITLCPQHYRPRILTVDEVDTSLYGSLDKSLRFLRYVQTMALRNLKAACQKRRRYTNWDSIPFY